MKRRETSAAAFAAMATEYDAWFDHSPVFALELAALDLLAPDTVYPVIEIGCGTGRFSGPAGVDFGIDPARKCLQIARQRGIKTACARACALPFADASAGSVLFFFSLCFCDDQQLSLGEGARILKHGGTMVTAIINSDSPWGEEVNKKKTEDHPLYRYASLMTPERLIAILTEIGLEVTGSVSCLRSGGKKPAPREKPIQGIAPGAGCVIIASRKP